MDGHNALIKFDQSLTNLASLKLHIMRYFYFALIAVTVVMTVGCDSSKVAGSAQATELLKGAVVAGNVQEFKQLIKAGADVNAFKSDGKNLAHVAAVLGQPEILAALIDAGVDKDAASDLGVTPLLAAVLSRSPKAHKCASLLIDAGVNLNARNSKGTTPLILATTNKIDEVALKLIESGADIQAQTTGNKTTALIMASTNNMLKVAKLLVEKGASSKSKDAFGKAAIDYATSPEMVDILTNESR